MCVSVLVFINKKVCMCVDKFGLLEIPGSCKRWKAERRWIMNTLQGEGKKERKRERERD